MTVSIPETLLLLVTAILPIAAIFLVIHVAVRLAIRHEHRNHPER
jgi:hypothetical protein